MNATDECFREREAIAQVHGGLSPVEATDVAVGEFGILGQDELPETWSRMNRRWRAVVNEHHGAEMMDRCHAAIKEKHDVDSFKQLTIGQIWESIRTIEQAHQPEQKDAS